MAKGINFCWLMCDDWCRETWNHKPINTKVQKPNNNSKKKKKKNKEKKIKLSQNCEQFVQYKDIFY